MDNSKHQLSRITHQVAIEDDGGRPFHTNTHKIKRIKTCNTTILKRKRRIERETKCMIILELVQNATCRHCEDTHHSGRRDLHSLGSSMPHLPYRMQTRARPRPRRTGVLQVGLLEHRRAKSVRCAIRGPVVASAICMCCSLFGLFTWTCEFEIWLMSVPMLIGGAAAFSH